MTAGIGLTWLSLAWRKRLLLGLATRLGVVDCGNLGEWLLRLFIRPARVRMNVGLGQNSYPFLAVIFYVLLRIPLMASSWSGWSRIACWLTVIGRFIAWPWKRLMRHVPDVPWDRIGAWFDWMPSNVGNSSFLMKGTLVVVFFGVAVICTTPLSLGAQFTFSFTLWIMALVIRKIPGRLPVLLLISMSLVLAGRYIWWRTSETLDLPTLSETIIGYMLYAAEAYTWLILLFGYIQTAWPLNRQPAPLPVDHATWPSVDVYIPTYNEPLFIVRSTVFAALSMDWPADRLHVYLLDDGRRSEFRQFAEEAGVSYIMRDNNRHAKAGNINQAMPKTKGEYIAIFDCDHIPTRSFLQLTMGEFLKDEKCAMVQTPHHFFSPDPFEKNLGTFRQVPNEGNLFYGLVQDGNDFWNATFFCGSCAVIKRAPLERIGGIAVETVTEDAHTALKLHRLGYNTAYIRTVQAAGLATESLAGHIGQRIRWARGMAQIFRIDNPFLGSGLSIFQRICYGNAMLHFFYGIPRLIFLVMPIAFFMFGMHVINTSAVAIATYVLPSLFLANLTNARIQGRFRHSYWAEVYESVLAWYIVLPTTMALINPKLGKFNVTDKGGQNEQDYFDWTISKPYLILLFLNFLGFAIGLGRLLFWGTGETGAVVLNMVWATFNLALLGAAVAVAREVRQVRVSHRIPIHAPATVLLPGGRTLACLATNYSSGGLGLELPVAVSLSVGDRIGICLSRGNRQYHFPSVVARYDGKLLGAKLEANDILTEMRLVQCTFGRADAWMDWSDEQPHDSPLKGFLHVIRVGSQGYMRLLGGFIKQMNLLMRRYHAWTKSNKVQG
jgi:cellulose synthase (UDP-forming)